MYRYQAGEQVNQLPVMHIMGSDGIRFIGYASEFQWREWAELIPGNTRDGNLKKLKLAFDSLKEDANLCLLFYEFK